MSGIDVVIPVILIAGVIMIADCEIILFKCQKHDMQKRRPPASCSEEHVEENGRFRHVRHV